MLRPDVCLCPGCWETCAYSDIHLPRSLWFRAEGLNLGDGVCRRNGWKCVGGGVGALKRARQRALRGEWSSLQFSPPTLLKVPPDWLRGRSAQVTFARVAERGRPDPRGERLILSGFCSGRGVPASP